MKKINFDNIYILNPAYKLKNDIKRVILLNNNTMHYDRWIESPNYSVDYSVRIHPLMAFIFSFFNGTKTLRNIIDELFSILEISKDEIYETIEPLIFNKETIPFRLMDKYYALLPVNFLIEKNNNKTRDLLKGINISEMLKDVDLVSYRSYIPNEFGLMITNNCYTDCIYCYADISHKVDKMLPFKRVKELIAEAYKLGCSDVGIIGGDFFLYKNWKELIKVLHKYEYEPYISTKYPINEETILTLKDLNIKSIQISLDSVNINEIKPMLNVGDSYLPLLKESFNLLKKHGLGFRIKSVISKYNDNIESIKNLVNYLLNFENLISLSLAPGAVSSYKPYDKYESNLNNISIIENYVNSMNEPRLFMQGYMRPTVNLPIEERIRTHNQRSNCSGNMSTFFVLPDGKVTLCEQLYWHPFFILGDLSKQSIMEMWNSEKTLSLWNITQNEIQEASACKTCDEFDECRRGRGSCWRLAIQAYGKDNYDYPYPDCPHAPAVTESFYLS